MPPSLTPSDTPTGRHAELGAVWVPIVVAHACTKQRGRVQLAAAFFVADSCTFGVAEPEPDCCSIARAEHASEHDSTVSDSERFAHRHAELGTVWVPIIVAHACTKQRCRIQLAATFLVADSGTADAHGGRRRDS